MGDFVGMPATQTRSMVDNSDEDDSHCDDDVSRNPCGPSKVRHDDQLVNEESQTSGTWPDGIVEIVGTNGKIG